MSDLVSVIIPCYDQGEFLTDAVASVREQTHEYWEAIIVNDGSSDNTEEIALALCATDKRVRYIAKQNGGLSSARNTGIQASRGKYIQFLDADDRIAPKKFELQLARFLAHPEVGVLFGNAWYFQEGKYGAFERGPYAKAPNHDWIKEAWKEPLPLLQKFLERNIIPVCAPLVRRETIESVGLFSENLLALEDWEYWFRCSIAEIDFLFQPEIGSECYIRMHTKSMTRSPDYVCRKLRARFVLYMSFMRYLPTGVCRRTNFYNLLSVCAGMDAGQRNDRFRQISGFGLMWSEKLILLYARLFYPGGRFYPMARYVNRHIVRKLQTRILL